MKLSAMLADFEERREASWAQFKLKEKKNYDICFMLCNNIEAQTQNTYFGLCQRHATPK